MFAKLSMLLLVTAMPLSACVQKAAFGTETRAVWCAALYDAVPTASVRDTPQTQEEVADVGDVIDTLCEEYIQ